MKKISTLLFALVLSALVVNPVHAATSVVYNALPNVLPITNYPSLGFQATQTKEFGDYVHLTGTARVLDKVTVTMSDWAVFSDYSLDPQYSANNASWTHPMTLNIYSVVPGTPNTAGALLGSITQSITIPWRPAEDPVNCPTKTTSGYKYKFQSIPGAPDTNCLNGLAFNAVFDLSSLNLAVPDDIVVSIAFNTNTWGYAPLNKAGPYESLNVAVPTDQAVIAGSDDNTNKVFWNSVTSTGGVFIEDSDWSPNGTVALQITASTPDGKFVNHTKSDFFQVAGGSSDNVLTDKPYKGHLTVVDPMGANDMVLQGVIDGLLPSTKYSVWVRDLSGYTGESINKYEPLGYYKLVEFTTNKKGNGNFNHKVSDLDLPDGTYKIQVAINIGDPIGETVAATEKYLTVTVKTPEL